MPREESSKHLAHRWANEFWNAGNASVADELYAPTYLYQGQPRSVEVFKRGLQAWRSAFPDLHVSLDQVIAEGDHLVWYWNLIGTHQARLFNAEPTGNVVSITGIHLARIADGRIVEEREWFDETSLLSQLRIAPYWEC